MLSLPQKDACKLICSKTGCCPAISTCAVIGDKVSYHPCHVKILSLIALGYGAEMLPIKAVPCSELQSGSFKHPIGVQLIFEMDELNFLTTKRGGRKAVYRDFMYKREKRKYCDCLYTRRDIDGCRGAIKTPIDLTEW